MKGRIGKHDIHVAIQEHNGYMWARRELARYVSEATAGSADLKRKLGGLIWKHGDGAFYHFHEAYDGLPNWVRNTQVSNASSLRSKIAQYRSASRGVSKVSAVQKVLMDTVREAESVLSLMPKKFKNAGVRIARGGDSAVLRPRWSVPVSPMWLKRVHMNGIHTPDYKTGVVFTTNAVPKPSAFLAEMGVTVYDATVFMGIGSPDLVAGFIFHCPSTGDVVFREDFMMGATLIKARVNRKVMSILTGGMEK